MAETAGVLQYDLTANLEPLEKGVDKAEGVLKKSGSEMAAGFSKAVVGATVVAGAAAVAFGKTAFDAFSEAEQASSMLSHAVRNVSKGTEEQLEATSALADELERKGVLDGDNIKMGLAQLSTFGLSNQAVQALGGSLADLAVNQFGVSASGEQLSDTANMIAKALNGQFGVLEKSGIRFTEAQQNAIKYGTEMEKVKAINEGFAQNLKYTNEVALQDNAGKLAHAKVQMGNFQESIGALVAQGIGPLLTAFNGWIERMGGVDAIMTKITEFIKNNLVWFQAIGIFVGTVMVAAFGAWAVATIAATWPLLAIAAAVTAVIVGIKTLISNWDGVKQAFSSAGSWIMGVVDKFWLFLGPLGLVIKGIKELVENWDKIKGGFSSAWSSITGFFGGARALGGPVTPGKSYLVGERGPELFTPSTSGNISNNKETMAMIGSGAGGNITINVGSVNDDAMLRRLVSAIEEVQYKNQRRTALGLA